MDFDNVLAFIISKFDRLLYLRTMHGNAVINDSSVRLCDKELDVGNFVRCSMRPTNRMLKWCLTSPFTVVKYDQASPPSGTKVEKIKQNFYIESIVEFIGINSNGPKEIAMFQTSFCKHVFDISEKFANYTFFANDTFLVRMVIAQIRQEKGKELIIHKIIRKITPNPHPLPPAIPDSMRSALPSFPASISDDNASTLSEVLECMGIDDSNGLQGHATALPRNAPSDSTSSSVNDFEVKYLHLRNILFDLFNCDEVVASIREHLPRTMCDLMREFHNP